MSSREAYKVSVQPNAVKFKMKRNNGEDALDATKKRRSTVKKKQRSTERFLQNTPCYKITPRLPRCRECRRSAAARTRAALAGRTDDDLCRFIAFRKLRYNEEGLLEVNGFADPRLDPKEADVSLWSYNLKEVPVNLPKQTAVFLLEELGHKFCELFQQEMEACVEHMSEDTTIAWRQAVRGVREMCDVCQTTLFNYHWVCTSCGFVVCLDCYKCKKRGFPMIQTTTKDKDDAGWFMCSMTKEPHIQSLLMRTQIIPGDCFYQLVQQMHGICALYKIPLDCECPLSQEPRFRKMIRDERGFRFRVTVDAATLSSNGNESHSENSDRPPVTLSSNENESHSENSDRPPVTLSSNGNESHSENSDRPPVTLSSNENESHSENSDRPPVTLSSNENESHSENSDRPPVTLNDERTAKMGAMTIKHIDQLVTKLKGEGSDGKPAYLLKAYSISFVKRFISSEQTQTGDKSNIVLWDDASDEAGTLYENGGHLSSQRPLEANEANTVEVLSINAKPSPARTSYHIFPSLDWRTLILIFQQIINYHNENGTFSINRSMATIDDEAAASLATFPGRVIIQRRLIQQFLIGFLGDFEFLSSEHNTDDLYVGDNTLSYNLHSKKNQHQFRKGERTMSLDESSAMYPGVAHQWLCNGKLLRLLNPCSSTNYQMFHDQWERGQPVMVSSVSGLMNMELWTPQSFERDFGEQPSDLVNCVNGKIVTGYPLRVFWEGFQSVDYRLLDEHKCAMTLKLKDWPPGDDFAEMMPSRFDDLMKSLPLAEYTQRSGCLNLASRLPGFFVRPDLGPKMYSAYGSTRNPAKGTTSLHLDISDAVNVMVYVGTPAGETREEYNRKVLELIGTDDCDMQTRRRINEREELPGALWHIYHAQDADKIRSLLRCIVRERGNNIQPNHDPIHDQKWYLDANMRKRLLQEYQVEGYSIVQCAGDAIFIPAGAPHQVLNLHNCIKVAEDFVSPENVSYCFQLTNEFRYLSKTHSNHEDKLQIKNIVYHTVKDVVSKIAKPLIIMADAERPGNTVNVGNDQSL